MVVSAPTEGFNGSANELGRVASQGQLQQQQQPTLVKKKRMSGLFGRTEMNGNGAGQDGRAAPALVTMYTSPKPKDRKRPLLTLSNVSQAFAVYPERPELIPKSTLVKIEGLLGDEDMAAGMRRREGWILLMPEMDPSAANQATEMLKWVCGEHSFFCG
jgi:CCR4-NOT transcriptional complex subunit CAF120